MVQPAGARAVRRAALALAIAAGPGWLSACGAHQPPSGTGRAKPPVTAVRSDVWHPPTVSGPPSTANFCTLLVAAYQHIKTNVIAVNLGVRQQIVRDYIGFTPKVVAAAPPQIAPAASVYLPAIARVLGDLSAVGLDAAKTPPGQIGAIITDPNVQAASAQVLAFSQQYCHYDIAGAPG